MDRLQNEPIESGVSLPSFGDYATYISPFRRASPKSKLIKISARFASKIF